MNQELKDEYYDAKTGYSGLVKLYKRMKEKGYDITMSDVKAFLDKQYTHQINRADIRPKQYRTILANKPKDNYQMDLIIYDRFKDEEYRYILACIDVNSRYAYALPLKSRQVNNNLLDAVKKIFGVMGKPKNLNADNEFFQSLELQRYFNDNNIKLHISQKDEINKNAIVERFNRTLALLLKRWRDGTGRTDWSNALPDLIDNYNTSYHRTIDAIPKDVWEGKDTNNQTNIHTAESEINVNDLVRVKQIKSILGKGDALKYSKELYVVVEKKEGVKKYKLRDVKTKEVLTKPHTWFKDYEVKKVDSIVETQEGKEYVNTDEALMTEKQAQEEAKQAEQERDQNLDAEFPYQYEKELRNIKIDEKRMKELVEALKIKKDTSITERRKELNTYNKDIIKHLASVYNIIRKIKYGAEKKYNYKPKKENIEQILKEEKRRDLIK